MTGGEWVIREGITQFVLNGYTEHSVAIVHTPECHHVRESMEGLYDPMLDVVQRYPETGSTSMRVDLLMVLFENAYGPVEERQVGFCQHCVVERAKVAPAA